MGALFGVTTLTGITLVYGAGRTTSYPLLHTALAAAPHGVTAAGVIAVVAGLMFKAGGVPAHFWVPDVTEGTSTPVAAFVTTVPKIGALAALLRLLSIAIPASAVNWPLLIAVLAAASMTLGNLAAFFQTSVKRLLAYSTISQVGYLLMAVAVATRSSTAPRSLLFYLAAYAVTNLAAFAVVAELPHARTIASYRGLAARHPGLAAVLVVSLLGLVGTPPTAVFLGKLQVFTATIDGGYGWLAGLAVVNTVASLFYYLRWLVPAFLQQPRETGAEALEPAGRWAALVAYTAGAASLAMGIAAAPSCPWSPAPHPLTRLRSPSGPRSRYFGCCALRAIGQVRGQEPGHCAVTASFRAMDGSFVALMASAGIAVSASAARRCSPVSGAGHNPRHEAEAATGR